ncbi:hypothetical protein NMY22_g8322 [Coprinellus aureogranulatus]|nr:hypothetical protein NMY22_g8322 [Coprinellus aureogranulatus]
MDMDVGGLHANTQSTSQRATCLPQDILIHQSIETIQHHHRGCADDYFAMYVNGVLVQVADTAHDYKTILAYNVPLPVVTNDTVPSVVLGFRVVNKSDNAGLLVAAQVNYEGVQAPDVFWTGKDQTWLGETLFQEHWEQPWFDSTTQASSWRPATVYTQEELDPKIPTLVRQEVMVMGALSAETGNIPQGIAPTPIGDSCSGSNCGLGIGLSKGGFVGVLVGSVVLAFLLGSAISFLLARRRFRDRTTVSETSSAFWGVAPPPHVVEFQPTTKPGRPQHHGPLVIS